MILKIINIYMCLFFILLNLIFSDSIQDSQYLSEKIDINNSTYDVLSTLNLDQEKISAINSYLIYNEIKDIYELLDIRNINIAGRSEYQVFKVMCSNGSFKISKGEDFVHHQSHLLL